MIEEASEQPASRSGIRIVFSGLSSFDVSAMKWTPAWTITSASVLGCFLGELQAVAANVADAVEDFRRHVVVRQDGRVALLLERVDRLDQRRVVRPLERRDDMLHALIKRFHFLGQRRT